MASKILLFITAFFVVDGSLSDRDYLLGKFDPATDARFSKLGTSYASGSATGGFLRKEAYDAFVRMADAARKDGVHLVIISATRTFAVQKQIWENKWNGKTIVEGKNLSSVKEPEARARIILKFSSMPGTSRHHWGTDMDLNNLENSYFESGTGLKIYQWLQNHGVEYGFCQPYTSKTTGRTGYEEERWHWSYTPLSVPLLNDYRTTIHDDDIRGFAGSETADSLKIVEEFVQGVSCK